jgi:hypothetical protein
MQEWIRLFPSSSSFASSEPVSAPERSIQELIRFIINQSSKAWLPRGAELILPPENEIFTIEKYAILHF